CLLWAKSGHSMHEEIGPPDEAALGVSMMCLGQGDSSSNTLPFVSIANSSVISPPASATAANAANTYWIPKSATIDPTRMGPIDEPALSQALPRPVPTARRRVGESSAEYRYSENAMVCRMAYAAVAKIRTWIAEAVPIHASARSGIVPIRNAAEYHGFLPTLSIKSAQTIDATTPTLEVIQP